MEDVGVPSVGWGANKTYRKRVCYRERLRVWTETANVGERITRRIMIREAGRKLNGLLYMKQTILKSHGNSLRSAHDLKFLHNVLHMELHRICAY